MSGLKTKDIISELRGHTRYVYLKVPQNFDFEAVMNYNTDLVELEKTKFMISVKKGTYYYASLLEFINPDNSIIWKSFPRTKIVELPKDIQLMPGSVNDLLTDNDCDAYSHFINSIQLEYPYNSTILDMTSSFGLFIIISQLKLKQPLNFVGIERNNEIENMSKENIKKYFPKLEVTYFHSVTDYVKLLNERKDNEHSKEFILFNVMKDMNRIQNFITGILKQIPQIPMIIINISEACKKMNIINIPSEFSFKISEYLFNSKKYYFLIVYNNLYYYLNNSIIKQAFNKNIKLKEYIKEFLNLRFHIKCPLIEGFIYQTLKELSLKENNDKDIINNFINKYNGDTIKETYNKSEASKFSPYLLGRNISKVEMIQNILSEFNIPTPKNILVVGIIDCDISEELHKKYTESKIYSIDVLDYEVLYGTYNKILYDDNKIPDYEEIFDLVIIQSLHHFKNQIEIIKDINNKLKDNGNVILSELHCKDAVTNQFYNILHMFHDMFLLSLKDYHENTQYRTINDWIKLIESQKFKLLNKYPIKPYYYILTWSIFEKV